MPDLKRTCSIQKFIGQHSHTPDIYLLVVVLMLDYFRRGVNGSSALGVPQHGSIDSPSKITNFNGILVQKDVLSFYVSVNHILFVHVFNS